jgi:hypothetical protein
MNSPLDPTRVKKGIFQKKTLFCWHELQRQKHLFNNKEEEEEPSPIQQLT